VKETPATTATTSAIAASAKSRAVSTVAAAPAAPATDGRAASLVRSYLEALARGDRATAASYLSGSSPSETFMNAGSHIETIRSASAGARKYQVTADVQTASGEYYTTFMVEDGPTGLQITDHYTIKPQ
jgi:hypothetical protein